MIIDDNAVDLYIASRMVTSNQFADHVIGCLSGLEALVYLQNNGNNPDLLPQIIFTDIYMPLMTGFEFLESYDQLPQSVKAYCRVFMLSSSIDDSDIIRSQTDKNSGKFLVKPITKKILDDILAGLL
ncbi:MULTISPECIES: response regulator [unclassified Flavobacterium]|uniref:response regulator n=1 Tax=unclassified Flavobacterium TaxID=196869 RepID=UPI0025B91168|nr:MULTISPECIES: response regulator [unclassified Flavobacterium]